MRSQIINPINQNSSYNVNNTNFKAIPRAEFGYLENKKLIAYQLEKSDIKYLEHILKNLKLFFKKYDIDGKSARQVLEEALNAGIAILKGEKHTEDKARIFMVFCDDTPSSFVIGDVLKIDKKGNFHYSSRREHGEKEGEADWVVTFNKNIPNEGQATMLAYLKSLLKDGFDSCFVRSELEKYSKAVGFYTRMGFKKLSNRPRAILRKDDYGYVIGKFDDKADKIIPMLATKEDIIRVIDEKSKELKLKEITKEHSCTLPEEVFD